MQTVTIADLKGLFPLSLKDEEITPHLNRAIWDFNSVDFADELQQIEVIGCKALYYLAPLLWVNMQNRAAEYEESLETFKDVEKFKASWLERSSSALYKVDTKNEDEEDDLKWLAI